MSSGPLPVPAAQPATRVNLLAGGLAAFERILQRIDGAERSILLRCFEWRDDETGDTVARHLLAAADRGVAVTILKDRVGMHYEYLEGSRQSFFHKDIDLLTRMQAWFLMAAYGSWDSLRQRANPLVGALLCHDRVDVVCSRKRFDHSKLYLFDDQVLILGGMGIGDDFRRVNVDFMVEVTGREAVERYRDRYAGRAGFDPRRPFDYLLTSFEADRRDSPLLDSRLSLIDGARERLIVEMAYMGDERCTDALVAAVNRGVELTLLTADRTRVLGDLNLHTCDQILRRTGAPDHLRLFLHPRMVHGKAVVVDGQRVDIGSANFTPLSHEAYEEVNLYARDRRFAREVEQAIERDILVSRPAGPRVAHHPIKVTIEKAVVGYQAKRRRRGKAA